MTSGRRWLGNSSAYAVVVEALMDAAYTIDELVALSGLAWATTWKFVKAMQRRRRAYIAVWRTDKQGRYTKPAYKLGTMDDMPRPAPKSAAYRSTEVRRRRRKALLAMTRSYDEDL
jgi:hypothetical protein